MSGLRCGRCIENRLVVAKREGEGVALMGSLAFWIQTVTFGMDGQWGGGYCTAQGTVCDWVTLLYKRN